jgi:tetratricopeptide (TPR) repeat protein
LVLHARDEAHELYGETVVIDWGLAKDLSATTPELVDDPIRDGVPVGETVGGQVLGTPAYMPPEQALGDAVDERADVYALGAMLDHLLSGAPPYHGTSINDVLANVITGPPPALAIRAPGLPADLVAIVEKAMAPRPEHRYANAGELAFDLKRFHSGQLVGAHRYTGRQLLRRWLRKHRTAVAVAAFALVAVIAVVALSMTKIIGERQRADEQRLSAERSRADAEELMDFMLGDLRNKLRAVGKLQLLEVVARKAGDYYQHRPDARTPNDELKRSVSLQNLGDVLLEKGDSPTALANYRAALGILEGLGGEASREIDVKFNLSNVHGKIGQALIAKNAAAALVEFRTASSIVEQLIVAEPGNPKWQRLLAMCQSHVGDVLLQQGDTPGAAAAHRESVALLEQVGTANPGDTGVQRELSVYRTKVGIVLAAQGDLPGADEHRAHEHGFTACAPRGPDEGCRGTLQHG